MRDEERRLRYWIVGENWPQGWFLLSLLAGLFFGIPGLVGAVTSYIGLRAVGPKLPRAVAAAVALALGVLAIITVQAVLAQL